MEEYIILMRLDLITKEAQPSPEQLQEYMKMYHDWVNGIIAQNKFNGGVGLSTEGKVIRKEVVTDGPYAGMSTNSGHTAQVLPQSTL